MKRSKGVEPVWVTWREPGESWIKVGDLIWTPSIEVKGGFSTVLRAGELVKVETDLLRPRVAA